MAFQYGQWSPAPGYDGKLDLLGDFSRGREYGKGIKDEQTAPDAFGKYLDSLTGGQTDPLSSLAVPPSDKFVNGSHAAAEGASDPMLNSYFAATRRSESGGNDAAKNPNSTATGRYQFLESTWNDLMTRHPELGLTADGRTDPTQQERAIRTFTQENASALGKKGVGVNPGSLYAAHFLGAGGAGDVLTQQDTVPVASLVPPEVVKANPQLANMTVGQFKQWAAEKGGAGGGYVAPQAAMPQTAAPAAGGGLPPREVMLELFKNPNTRPLAIDIAKTIQAERAAGRDPTQSLELEKLRLQVDALRNPQQKPPEVETRFNPETGLEEKVVYNSQSGAWEPFGGQKATAASTRQMSPTTQKELFEAEDSVNAGAFVVDALQQALTLNETAYEGPFSDVRGDSAALVNIPGGKETSLLKNLTTELALNQLKATFGAAPTEGERKILMDLQGSVNQPRAVRQEIFKRALDLANRRISINRDKANALRSGEYFQSGYVPPNAAQPADASGEIAQPQTPEEYDALPPGALFIDPEDGQQYRKP